MNPIVAAYCQRISRGIGVCAFFFFYTVEAVLDWIWLVFAVGVSMETVLVCCCGIRCILEGSYSASRAPKPLGILTEFFHVTVVARETCIALL